MSRRTVERRAAVLLASAVALLMVLTPMSLRAQQLGRQRDLGPQELQTLQEQVAELGGRAIVGFKPAAAAQGMRPDGTPALGFDEVRVLAEGLAPLGVRVRRQFRIIPAVAATVDPARVPQLLANPQVDYIEPDYRVELHGSVVSDDLVQTTPWGITRVDAAGAWSITKGAGVQVGILDTGIDPSHPDLNPLGGINVITSGTGPDDWGDNSAYCPTHGTHVAGTVAALDNSEGVVGVAPEADLYAIRVFDPENQGTAPECYTWASLEIAGVEWAVTNGMDVINLSLGGAYPTVSVADAFLAAFTAGVVVVASSGNDNSSVGYPGGFPYAIAVGAIDQSDNRAYFSNFGSELDVAAPGVSILSTIGGGGYGSGQGTSMAAPHVTGVAVLVRAARPDLGPEDVRQALYSTADDVDAIGYDIYTGWGVVQAGAAVDAVATSNLALSLVPGEITVVTEPGGDPIVTAVEVRNVGAAGTISWTAADDASWIGLNTSSGTATDVTPGILEVTADPSGLSEGIYTGFVTVAGNAANSPAQMRVRLAVAPRIPLDAGVETAGYLPTGERLRFLLAGTAGQAIDVAVVADESSWNPLYDPTVRVYMPDGETMLMWNDDAMYAGLWYQSLVYNVTLPVDGDYIVEVGSWRDSFSGGFLLKARPAGPILGVSSYGWAARGEEDASPVSAPLDVMNLSGVGTLEWTATSPDSWISIDPSSGTINFTGTTVSMDDFEMPAPVVEEGAGGEVETGGDPAERNRRISEAMGVEPAALAKTELASLRPGPGAQFALPRLDADVQATTVSLIMDPTGLPLDWNSGTVEFHPADGWLSPAIPVDFYVYSHGMQILPYYRSMPREMATDDTRPGDPPVAATTAHEGGSLIPISSDGTLGDPITSGTPYPGGLTLGLDANWYVGSRLAGDYRILKVTHDGVSSDFVTLPSSAFFIGWGPEPAGDLYASTCNIGKLWKITADGSSYEQFGPGFNCPSGVAYRPQDNSLYVANGWGTGLTRIPLDDPSATSSIAENVDDPWAVAIGASGTVYFTNDWGYLWSIDPDTETDASQLGLAPANIGLKGLALAEGALMISSYDFGELYRFPISDSPIPHPEPEQTGEYAAYLDLEQIDAVQGESFDVPLVLETFDGSDLPVAAYQCRLDWHTAELDYVGYQEGDFGGTFIANATEVDQGIFQAVSARATDVGVPSSELFSTTWDLLLEPGQCADMTLQFSELSSEAGGDLLPLLDVMSPISIGLTQGKGDVTQDGQIGAADAVQILRHLVGLPTCEGCDVDQGDANCDGIIQAADAVTILRWLVGLPVADACVGVPRIGPCTQ